MNAAQLKLAEPDHHHKIGEYVTQLVSLLHVYFNGIWRKREIYHFGYDQPADCRPSLEPA